MRKLKDYLQEEGMLILALLALGAFLKLTHLI